MKASTLNSIAPASALALLVLFPNEPALAQGCPAPSFAPAVHYGTGSGCRSVAVGDFNGDGKPDLASANRYATNISVLLGNGNGTFQTAVSYGAGSYYEAVAVADFNGDGKADLAVSNGSFGNISVLLGIGDGTFQSPVTYGAGTHPGPLAVADFNKDGKPDLGVANIYTDDAWVFLGNGDGTFQKAASYSAGEGAQSVAVGDCNGDGNPDLVVPHHFLFEFWVYSGVAVLLGNGDGTFQGAVDHVLADGVSAPLGDWPVAAVVGDFNGDNKPDLAVANQNNNASNSRNVLVLSGNGNGTFQHATNSRAGLGTQAVAVSDFNGDGQLDLAAANGGSDNVSVLVGNGDGTFQAATNYGVGDRPRSVAVADFNNDGNPDVVVANETSGNVSVLLNTCASSDVHLAILPGNATLTLSWPLSNTNVLLESTTHFSSTNWQQVLETMTTNNGRCEVTVPLDQAQRYFRLRKLSHTKNPSILRKEARIMKTHSISAVSAVQAVQKTSLAKLSVLFALLSAALFVVPFATAQANRPPTSYRPDRILLKLKPGADLTELHRSLGTTVHRSYPALGRLQTVRLRPDASVTNMLARFRQSALVEYAEPDYLVRAFATPNDQFFAMPDNDPGTVDQWGLNNAGQDSGTVDADIDAPEAWNIRTTAESVIVAVIDTGVRYTHEELAPNMWTNPTEIPGNGIDDDGNSYVDDVHGIDALACTGDPTDNHGHGTHVAGIIGARGNNGVGVAGVAWRVQIMACGFLDVNAQGYISDAIECIDYARNKGAKIINASWGDYFTGPFNGILPDFQGNATNSRALHDAIANARNAGIIFVAASGNDGTDNDQHPLYPASYSVDTQHGQEFLPALDNIIGVAATDRDDEHATFPQGGRSNYGASSVHLAAPGTHTISSYGGWDDNYAVLHGTSMAAALVSGACALVWAQYPTETYQQIINRVLVSTDSLPSMAGKSRTSGRLNLHKALTVVPAASRPTGSMLTKRYGHSSTLLPDGKVLVAGGYNSASGYLDSTELYDPATGAWTETTNLMTTARSFHTAVLLNNGTVLVAGGQGTNGYLASAELYHPTTGVWTATTNSIATARAHHTATLLPNGKVLVAGGWNTADGELLSAELYIP